MNNSTTNAAPAADATKLNEVQNTQSLFNVQFMIKTLLLNWQWILLSVFICLCIALVYIRYTAPVYQVDAQILVKDDDKKQNNAANAIQSAMNLGIMNNTSGFDNELEILKSVTVSQGVVNDLKLYVNYSMEGHVTDRAIYKTSPVTVDMAPGYLKELYGPIDMKITREGSTYEIKGEYTADKKGKVHKPFEKSGSLPMVISLPVGKVSVMAQPKYIGLWDGDRYIEAIINNPRDVAKAYVKNTSVSALSKTTTIAQLSTTDIVPERSIDFLKDLAVVYNRQANEDKNQIAVRTEFFINDRIKKLNVELGGTDSKIQDFKSKNNVVDITANAAQALTNTNDAEKKLTEMGTQILLLQSIKEFMMQPANKHKPLPSNVGLTDPSATALITQYNSAILERNRLLQAASELSPNVQAATAEIDNLSSSISRAVDQAMRGLKIQQQTLANEYSKYSGMTSQTPQQERILTEIGRQQTVKEGLYLMLLQKREENSIELAATADKGKLIDEPDLIGKVKPKGMMVLLIALIIGIAIPYAIFFLIEMLRFRIEGHEDVENLTKLPIIADIAVANDNKKGKGDIVVHENQNNQMEEIFRGMRTNIQFMLKDNQNVIMLTSSTSGEGKTFVAANMAVSFALLGRKVLIMGLDIRRPRLSALFGLQDKDCGISMLLTSTHPTLQDIKDQIIPSGVNKNLDIMPAGPVPPNPTELLSRTTLEEIFEILRKEYDFIICDTAPVGLVTDTLQLARVVDATVFVCRADYTEKSAFPLFNDLAASGKLPNVSIAINGIDMARKKYGYAYGYGKYGKYGKYGNYSHYGSNGSYKSYGYHSYGYGTYSSSHYSNPNDDSIKK